jgi:hypothetical protein
MTKVLKIDAKDLRIEDTDDMITVVMFTVLDSSRITNHGAGTFLENLQKGEVEWTDAGREAAKTFEYRDGVQGAEIFAGPKVVSWMGICEEAVVPAQHVSCDTDSMQWLLSL